MPLLNETATLLAASLSAATTSLPLPATPCSTLLDWKDAPLSSQIYPPAPMRGGQLAMLVPYVILFLLGVVGNIAVLSYVFFITRSLKWSVMALGNTLVYILVLSAVDLLVILSIPFHTSQQVLNSWVFGAVICKLYWVLEWASKMCSTFILTALAFDRYMAICHPEIKRIHNIRQTFAIVLFTAVLSLVLILPISISATVKTVKDGSRYIDRAGQVHLVESSQCRVGLDREQKQWLLGLLTVVVFIIPCTLITFFYGRITLRLRKQLSSTFKSRIPIRRITIYTLIVTLFYIVCHTPFWFLQIYGFISMTSNAIRPGPYLEYVLYVTHMFPYVAAAMNWLFYAQLNSQFKKGLVLVTERWIRKQTRASAMQPLSANWDGVCVDLASRCDDVIALCPNCEHPLTLRANKYSVTNNT